MSQEGVAPFDAATTREIQAAAAHVEPLVGGLRRSPLTGGDLAMGREDLREMAGLLDLFKPQTFTSHRPVVGPIIVLMKTVVAGIARRALRLTMGRQVELNHHFWNMARTVHHLDRRVRELERALADRPS